MLNAAVVYQEITGTSFFRTVTLILLQNLHQNFVLISKNSRYF